MFAALIPIFGPALAKAVEAWFQSKFPNPAERDQAAKDLLAVLQASDAAQLKVNEVEAAHANVFVSGWRPFIGWICGAGLGWTFVGAPVLAYILTLYSPGTPLPVIPTDNLMELVLAMLGLGGLRTFEKIRKATK